MDIKTLPCYTISKMEADNKLKYITPDLSNDNQMVFDKLGFILKDFYPVYGLPFIYVNKNGDLFNLDTGMPIKTYVERSGYKTFITHNAKGEQVSNRVHRMVLLAFRPIEDSNLYMVNHKDGNKQNNNIENLEWVTHAQNVKHYNECIKKGSKVFKNREGILVKDHHNGDIVFYSTLEEMSKVFKVNPSTIRMRLKHGKDKLWDGRYQYMYKSDYRNKDSWPVPTKATTTTCNRMVDLKWLATGETLSLLNIRDVRKLTGLSASSISMKVNVREPRPFYSSTGRLFQIKWHFSPVDWVDTSDMLKVVNDADCSVPVLVLVDKLGNCNVFHGLTAVCEFTNMNKTKAHYRFKINRNCHWDNEYQYYSYDEYLKLYGKIPEDKQILHFEIK